MSRIRFVNDYGNGHSGYLDYDAVNISTASGTYINTRQNGELGSDSFGRLRVSEPFTLFDSQHRYYENDQWSTASGGSATTSYQTNESAINFTVTTVSGDYIYHESKKVFPYQPGKTLLCLSSFVFAPAQANLRQRVGYFGAQNGVYFEQEGTETYIVLRSYVTGSVVNTRIPRSQWNGDLLNGLGTSGQTLNTAKGNIFWCDLEWLGVGDVRTGFVIGGQFILCHTFRNTNKNNTTYMTTAALPLRMEIQNLDTIASGTTAKQICNTVISEGGYTVAGKAYSADLGTTEKTLTTAGTTYPVISIRLNSSRLDAVVVPRAVQALVTSNSNVKWSIVKNPTLSGASYSTHSNGTVDVDTTATSMSGGVQLSAGYLEKQSQVNIAGLSDFTYQLGRTIGGTSDVLTLAATPLTNTTKVLFSLGWTEVL